MGLTSGMYSGVSGLLTHGEAISVIGNNIANVSTLGYKGSRVDFEDALSQEVATSSGPGQVGRGVNIGAIMKNFHQGSFESTTESTDMAIGGKGFFMVQPKGEDINYYTRAGNFRFDQEGYLVDPHGYVVQGWMLDNSATGNGIATVGVPTDIRLENFQSPPQASTNLTMAANLDSNAEDSSTDATNPFFSLYSHWDSSQDSPLGSTRYAYQSTIKTYDQNGSAHNMSVYFDPVQDYVGSTGGDRHWEFMVTVDPSEDGRAMPSTTDKAGVLMMGSLTFGAGGELKNMSAYTLKSGATASGGSIGLDQWQEAELSSNGLPITTANFTGVANADYPDQADASPIEINFGLSSRSSAWGGAGNASTVGTTPGNLIDISPADVELDALTTTSYDTGDSATLFQSQDGYAAGFLQSISTSRDGVLTGRYSNGQVIEHYALTIADFNNQWGLTREGGNLFAETRSSGPPLTGLAGTGGRGTIASNSLEQSNVDLATEFVKMITTERGFQANSKVIRTTDSMLAELIQLKR